MSGFSRHPPIWHRACFAPHNDNYCKDHSMATQLKASLGTLHLWGIAVGLVISGEYFGWSYG